MYNILYRMEFRDPEIVELIIAALKRIYNSLDFFCTTAVLLKCSELFACHNEKRTGSEKEE